jgi:hypothetical protein
MEGDHILKIFGGNKSLYFSLSQSVQLEPGEYKLTIRAYPDVVMDYADYEKVFADDVNAALIQFGVNGNASSWRSFNPVPSPHADDRLQVIEHTFTVDQSDLVDLEVVFMLPFANDQNGIFCDAWMLERVDEPVEPPPVTDEFPYRVFDKGSRLGTHNIARANDRGDILGLLSSWTAGGGFPSVVKAVDHFDWVGQAREMCPDSVIIGRVTSGIEGCQGVENPDADLEEMAGELVEVILQKIGQVPTLLHDVDCWEVCNEPDPPGALGYAQLARLMIHCMRLAEEHDIKLALFSLNAGTPEWDEMEAMVETGVFERARQGEHILALHEGVFDDQPVWHWWGDLIPGAPEVGGDVWPYAGALCFRYRYLYYLLEQRGAVIPLVLTEFRTHGANFPKSSTEVEERFRWYDEKAREDYYVWGVCLFTLGATDQWYPSHDYGPNYAYLIRYALSIKDAPNAPGPVVSCGHEGWVPPPRVPYDRYAILLPQDATLEQALEATRRGYPDRRTILYAADDAALYGPKMRTIELYGFPATGASGVGAHRAFFEQFYPGPDLTILEHGTVGEDEPDPPPVPEPTGELLCPHVQSGLDHVLDYVDRVKPAFVKVFTAEWARQIVERSPDTKVIWRNWWADYDQFVYAQDKYAAAWRFVSAQHDSLLANRDWIWGIEGVNEHMAEWLPETVEHGVQFALALCDVLSEINKVNSTNFSLIPLNLAVGAMGPSGAEAILPLIERLVRENWPLGLHSYWKVEEGRFTGPADSWHDTAGRFELMDAVFAARGLWPTYAFTEAGPCLWSGSDWVRPTQGWRTCYGNWSVYEPYLLAFRHLLLSSGAGKDGRVKFASLFTTHPGGDWDSFDHRKGEWDALARVLGEMG